ncbi:hypothetical protein [Streptomyces sp. NPDC004291]
MKRTVSALAALLALTALTGCDRFELRGGKSLDPMPADVPVTPQYTSPDEVVAALERAGIPCEVLRRRTGALGCEAQISGATVENRIQVLNPEEFSRDEVGAVVLPPPYPLPDIPSTPAHRSADALADALHKAGSCTDRERWSARELLCGSRAAESKTCGTSWADHHALLLLHDNAAARDDHIRLLLSNDHIPAAVVTAANWTIQFCDPATARATADALGGVLITHEPGT